MHYATTRNWTADLVLAGQILGLRATDTAAECEMSKWTFSVKRDLLFQRHIWSNLVF